MKNITLRTLLLALSMMALASGGFAQTHQITGTVKDATGPVVGATVVVKGTTKGVSTNLQGSFTIEVSPGNTLLISSLGYAPTEVLIANQTRLDVLLSEEAQALQELVVIGYGSQKKSDLTNAVATVNTKEMLATPSTNVSEMLRGRVSGIQVTSSSGRPGSAPSIIIRGRRSMLDTGLTPLFVVDGTTVDATEFNNINPNDVESVSVLKDAASQAIYGPRAANGVILLQTKRGQNRDGVVTFESKLGVQTLWRNFDYYSPMEWYNMKAEGVSNYMGVDRSTLTPEEVLGSDIMVDAYRNNIYTDWEKLMLHPAVNQEYNLSFRGGTDRMKIALGFGYFNQDGMIRTGSSYKRGNARLNLDYDVKKWLTVGANVSWSKSLQELEDGKFETYVGAPPLAQAYYPDGSLREWMNGEDINPLFLQAHSKGNDVNDINRYLAYLELRPLKGLSYRLNASYYLRTRENGSYTDRYYTSVGSMATLDVYSYQRELFDNIITYNVPFCNRDHALSLTAVSTYDNSKTTSLGESTRNIPVDRDWNMIADGEFVDDTRGYSENLTLGLMGRVTYNFKDRYLAFGSVSRYGSSRFGQNNKWATFWSWSLGWRISEEDFMKDVKWLSNLKLRFGYGEIGNQNGIPSYTTTPLATSYEMEFGDYPAMGYLPGTMMTNPFLKWETTRSYNLGLDFALFDNRLTGTVELYKTTTNDLLVRKDINSLLGYTYMYDNLGESETKGYELSLAYDIFRRKEFTWSISANITGFRNKIIRVDDRKDLDGKPLADVTNRWFPGYPINVYYDYIFDGIYQESDFTSLGNGQWQLLDDIDTDGDGYGDTHVIPYQTNCTPGMIKVRDVNNDGSITPDDRVQHSIDPKLIASLTTNLKWKGIDLMADFYGIAGGLRRNPLLYDSANGTLRGRYTGIKIDYWTAENPSNRWPRPNSMQNPALIGSAAIQKSDYIRLRTLVLGYTLPSELTRKVKIDHVRLSVTATNLWTKTEFLSYSPEYSANGYPEARQFLFGLNFSF